VDLPKCKKFNTFHKVEKTQRKPYGPRPVKPERSTLIGLWDSLDGELAQTAPAVAGGNNSQTLTDEDAEGAPCFRENWWRGRPAATMGLDDDGHMLRRREGH